VQGNNNAPAEASSTTSALKSFVRGLGVDLVGVAERAWLEAMPVGLNDGLTAASLGYESAIVMGAQLGKAGPEASGPEASLCLERAALEVLDYLEKKGYSGLIIHTEDEFDPGERRGLLSLKVLAKGAGLGWQGRSLLVVSPDHGPVHRLIAVLTNIGLVPDRPMANRCGQCRLCIDACPAGALSLVPFDDHPARREDVLSLSDCRGDDGCIECLVVCPWGKRSRARGLGG
jgi:epoxyqueuosine reductase